jgi:hypothetical protein
MQRTKFRSEKAFLLNTYDKCFSTKNSTPTNQPPLRPGCGDAGNPGLTNPRQLLAAPVFLPRVPASFLQHPLFKHIAIVGTRLPGRFKSSCTLQPVYNSGPGEKR